MRNSKYDEINELLNRIKIDDSNAELISSIRANLEANDMIGTLELLKMLQSQGFDYKDEKSEESEKIEEDKNQIYCESLADDSLERKYIGKLLNEVKAISVYYFPFKECYFVNDNILNIYKTILFTDADKYASEAAKEGFSFARKTPESDKLKYQLRREFSEEKESLEKIYTDLKKLFVIRKNYLAIPVKSIQTEIADILNYELYDKMSVEEVESAIEQVTITEKLCL